MLMMMEEKTDQCSHASYINHSVHDLFDDFELQAVSKRRIDVEPLLPSLSTSCIRRRPLQPHGSVLHACRIAIMRGYTRCAKEENTVSTIEKSCKYHSPPHR